MILFLTEMVFFDPCGQPCPTERGFGSHCTVSSLMLLHLQTLKTNNYFYQWSIN